MEQINKAHCVQSQLNEKRTLLPLNYRDGEKDCKHSCRGKEKGARQKNKAQLAFD